MQCRDQHIGQARECFAGLLGGNRARKNARADQDHLLLPKQARAVEEILVGAGLLQGSAELRTALGAKLTRFMGVPIEVDRELVVTCGATEAMIVAMMTVCDPGDKIIIPRNAHKSVISAVILAGAEPIYVMPKIDETSDLILNLTPEQVEEVDEGEE